MLSAPEHEPLNLLSRIHGNCLEFQGCFLESDDSGFNVGSMKNMERSVNNGLVALATSDLFLCLASFIASLYWNKLSYDSLLELYYRTYEESFINFFLLAR